MSQYLWIITSADEIQELTSCHVPGTKLFNPFLMKILPQQFQIYSIVDTTSYRRFSTDKTKASRQRKTPNFLSLHGSLFISRCNTLKGGGGVLWECYIECMDGRLILKYSSPTSQSLKWEVQRRRGLCFCFYIYILFDMSLSWHLPSLLLLETVS